MNEMQQDCIQRQGNCAGCLNALETFNGSCMVKWSPTVSKRLGLDRKMIEARKPKVKACLVCGEDFHYTTNQKYCSARCKEASWEMAEERSKERMAG